MKTIFVVDDNDVNLVAAENALSKHYNVFTLPSAASMFELLEDVAPDLVLLDIEMPEVNGFEALAQLKSDENYSNIPVIFLTSHRDAAMEVRGFELGAIDFIAKPFNEPVLLNRLKTHLNIDELIRERTAMLQMRTEKLQRLQNIMVSVLADMVESRDKGTGGHVERTSLYIKLLMDAMIERKVYLEEILDWDMDLVITSTRLHDVGKIMVSDLILNKPGALDTEEYETMKKHAGDGETIIERIIDKSGDEDFLHNARLFAGYHHERWDGTGYPRHLKGTEIPLQGRMMALVDVYDALASDRPYRDALTSEATTGIILEGRGTHFDPELVDVFIEIKDQFAKIAKDLCP